MKSKDLRSTLPFPFCYQHSRDDIIPMARKKTNNNIHGNEDISGSYNLLLKELPFKPRERKGRQKAKQKKIKDETTKDNDRKDDIVILISVV